jgi:hypothetical protein
MAEDSPVAEETQVDATPAWMNWGRQGLAVFAFVVLIAVMGFDVWMLGKFYRQLFNAPDELSDVLGVNKWLASAIGVVVISPLLWGIKRELEALTRKKELSVTFQVVIGLYACVFFGLMYWVGKEVAFSHADGTALRYYGVALDGRIHMYDSEGFDTTTGEPLKEVTKEIVFAFKQQEAGQSPVPVSPAEFQQRVYDGTTGLARVWYARHPDGHFGLYDRPGFDATLGVYLKPVTPEAAEEIRGWIESQASAERQRAEETAKAVERSAQREKDARAAAERLAFIERYIDRGTGRVAGMSTVAVRLMESNDANSDSVASAMDRALRDRGFNVVSLFKPAFGSEGLDRQLFEGSPSLARRLDLPEHCDSVVIGSVRMVMAPRSAGGMYITEMALQLRQISSTGSRLGQTEVREKGGALDARSSISAAIEKLAESAEAELAAWPRT